MLSRFVVLPVSLTLKASPFQDWFEYARLRGSYQLWTEDWMPDSASFRWSYYASRLRSSIALANHDGMEFSGYIVPRSSGGRDGGLLQRIVTLIGSGAKGVRYFDVK